MAKTLIAESAAPDTPATGYIALYASTSGDLRSKNDSGTDIAIAGFQTGTKMLFQQTAAPIGWTKDVTHNDKALRVVTGTAGSGGATVFSSVFGAGKATGSTVLTTAHLPASGLSIPSLSVSGNIGSVTTGGIGGSDRAMESEGGSLSNVPYTGTTGTGTTGNMGTGGGHTHTESLDLAFVDCIICTKI